MLCYAMLYILDYTALCCTIPHCTVLYRTVLYCTVLYYTMIILYASLLHVLRLLMQAQQNFVGWDGQEDCTASATAWWGGNANSPFATGGGAVGISMTCAGAQAWPIGLTTSGSISRH